MQIMKKLRREKKLKSNMKLIREVNLLSSNIKPTLLDLVESLGYIPTDLTWEGDVGYFSINNQKYSVTVTPAPKKDELTFVPFFEVLPKVGNMGFSMITTTGTTQDTTNTMGSSAFKVFASVACAVNELIKRHGYQIILCIAKRGVSLINFDSRVNIYETLTTRIAKNSGMLSTKLYTTEDAVVFIVFNIHLHKGIIKVQNHIHGN